MIKLKRLGTVFGMCAIVLCFAGCGNSGNKNNNQQNGQTGSSQQESSQQNVQQSTPQSSPAPENSQEYPDSEGQTADTVVNGYDYADGWTEEMEGIKTAITGILGEQYWPDTAILPDMLENSFGLTPDMYDDYLGEMPMISVKVDTLLIVKAKEGQEEAVEKALNDYRDGLVNDTMQYPSNLGKIQGSLVERIGSYVCFIQLGADTMDAMEQGDEAVINQCREANQKVLEVIRQQEKQAAEQ